MRKTCPYIVESMGGLFIDVSKNDMAVHVKSERNFGGAYQNRQSDIINNIRYFSEGCFARFLIDAIAKPDSIVIAIVVMICDAPVGTGLLLLLISAVGSDSVDSGSVSLGLVSSGSVSSGLVSSGSVSLGLVCSGSVGLSAGGCGVSLPVGGLLVLSL